MLFMLKSSKAYNSKQPPKLKISEPLHRKPTDHVDLAVVLGEENMANRLAAA